MSGIPSHFRSLLDILFHACFSAAGSTGPKNYMAALRLYFPIRAVVSPVLKAAITSKSKPAIIEHKDVEARRRGKPV